MLRTDFFSVANHAEQTARLRYAVNCEVGIKNLVAAVLTVGLRKHHQLNIGGIAIELGESIDQILDFVGGQSQAKVDIGFFQRNHPTQQHVNSLQWRGLQFRKQRSCLFTVRHHALGHTVMQQNGGLMALPVCQYGFAKQARLQQNAVFGNALDTSDCQITVAGNVSGF